MVVSLRSLSLQSHSNNLRVLKRARVYVHQNSRLYRRFKDLTLKEVPRPHERKALVKHIHETNGHFGRTRTLHMVLMGHWWPGIYKDVRDVVRACAACNQTNASFSAMQPELNPIPIRGLMYRWSLDLCGPFPISSRGNKYILVCIEGFSKWIETFPIPDKTSEEVAFWFHHGVLARFSSPAEEPGIDCPRLRKALVCQAV